MVGVFGRDGVVEDGLRSVFCIRIPIEIETITVLKVGRASVL